MAVADTINLYDKINAHIKKFDLVIKYRYFASSFLDLRHSKFKKKIIELEKKMASMTFDIEASFT